MHAKLPDATSVDGQRTRSDSASPGDAASRARLPAPRHPWAPRFSRASAPLGACAELWGKVTPRALRVLSKPFALVTGTITCDSLQHRTERWGAQALPSPAAPAPPGASTPTRELSSSAGKEALLPGPAGTLHLTYFPSAS